MRLWRKMAESTADSRFVLAAGPGMIPELPETQVCYSELFGKPLESSPHNTISSAQIIDPLANHSTTIHSLPDEVLSAIFDEGRRMITRQEGSSIIFASRVCQRWRDVAIHSPVLWNNIYYGTRFLSHEYTRACLERSQNCPLNITLHFCDAERPWFRNKLIRHIDQIIFHSNRWRDLDVHVHYIISLPILLSRLPRNVPILQRIRITLGSQDNSSHNRPIFDRGAPKLSSIELRGINFTSLMLPVERLTYLELTQSHTTLKHDEFRRILTASSSLRELSLSGDIILLTRDPWSPVHIPSLTSLTLSPGCEDSFRRICTMLVLPTLESITLQYFLPESLRIFVESFHTHTPTFPPLRSLELRTAAPCDVSVVEVITLFEKLHMITQLSLISVRSSTYAPLLRHCGGSSLNRVSSPKSYSYTPHPGSVDCLFDLEGESLGRITEYPDSPPLASESLELATPTLLPNLNTIGIVPIDETNIAPLCNLISSRAATKRAISCFKAFSYDRISSDRLQWLKDHVKLEWI